MAVKYWRGTTDDWATVGNWGGSLPASADQVVFDGNTNTNCKTNVDRTADDTDGLNLASLIVEDGYRGQIGAPGAPLMLCADEVILRGGGQVWLQAARDGGTALIDDLVVASPNADGIEISDDGTVTITRSAVLAGKVTFAADMGAMDILEILEDPAFAPPEVTINSSATAISQLFVGAGQVTSDRAVTVYEQMGGDVVHGTGAFSDTVIGGGRLRYDSTSAMAGRTVVRAGATLDVSELRALTIAALHQQPGGIVLRPAVSGLLTVTAEHLYGQRIVN